MTPDSTGTESPYSGQFFGRIHRGALRSAMKMVPTLLDYVHPSSVVDVGCGSGAWLNGFIQYGIVNVRGIDGPWVDEQNLPFPSSRFVSWDLTKPLRLNETFDLVLCLEVAEHLPPESAETLVDSLTRLGPVVLFSAAVPDQGGNNHLNEQWPEYWARLFEDRGFRAVDCFRRRIWDVDEIDWWYRQNAILYVSQGKLSDFPALEEEAALCPPPPERMIHPRLQMWFDWSKTRDRLQDRLNETLPVKSNVAIIDQEQLNIVLDNECCVIAFPERDGLALGPPPDDLAAINELDRILEEGVQYLVLPWTADWWIDFYPGFANRLKELREYAAIEEAWVFDLG